MILELTEIHAQLRWLHQKLMDILVQKGGITQDYVDAAETVLQYERRQSALMWAMETGDLEFLNRKAPGQLGSILQKGDTQQ